MNDMPRVMLLIDADNVSADVIEQAVAMVLARHGHLHVRRAYCNAEAAQKQQALFKRLSVRPMVNLSAGKNSTDIALAVDAMDLVIAERPQVVYLVSSDSDFAPLVIRLREKGCRVCGIGQKGKTGDETTLVYDEFNDLQHHAAATAAAAPKPAAAKRAPRAPRRAAAKPEAPAAAPRAPALPDEVIRILDAVPELLAGGKVELNQAAERLRAARLLGRSASSPKFFNKYPGMFWLTPDGTPNKVQYIGPTTL
ncbi:NYN domain protein [Variovorax sp. SRS16]|uniref:NYN domain-containing protein n=1 Tax=Variovorax sp. SRS16 TaxID=282217 RepID=UPI00131737F8|nr:NYN domain-containing protein [Variovorax sp. SRS16]VTU13943.1 NYN domain protein [Variovorax sp. SRS16]